MRKALFFLGGLFTLSACSTPVGQSYAPTPIKPKTAQLVIYHPSEFVGSVNIDGGSDVKVNGQVVCALPNSEFFVTSNEPGKTQISSTKLLEAGTSTLDIKTQANQRYFIRITWNGNKTAGGVIGEFLAQGVNYRAGPFVIEQVYPDTAMQELKRLVKVGECKS